MFDFGWSELLVIVAVAVFVIGPKDIPKIMYSLGRMARRVQYVRYALSQQFEQIMNQGDIEELRQGVNFEESRRKLNTTPEDEAGFDKEITEMGEDSKNDTTLPQ